MHQPMIWNDGMLHNCFNIRSFGSWNASSRVHRDSSSGVKFQYPLFRIVECINETELAEEVSVTCFNIRSFGSWNASKTAGSTVSVAKMFQYPLFRIVECILGSRELPSRTVPVSISALSDRGMHQRQSQGPRAPAAAVSISALSDRGMHLPIRKFCGHSKSCFNIRSFGSWNAS